MDLDPISHEEDDYGGMVFVVNERKGVTRCVLAQLVYPSVCIFSFRMYLSLYLPFIFLLLFHSSKRVAYLISFPSPT